MKNVLLFFVVAASLAGCNKEESASKTVEVQVIEEFMPSESKQSYVTKSGIELEVYDNFFILEGDILLTEQQVKELDEPDTRGAILNNNWPGGIVYYLFQNTRTSMFGGKEREKAYAAMNHYHEQTGVEFRHVSFKGSQYSMTDIVEKNFIHWVSSSSNSSSLGMVGGRQYINLVKDTGSTVGTVIHELGHALGLLHEQSRVDRDNYMNVDYNNIQSSKNIILIEIRNRRVTHRDLIIIR